MKIAFQLFAASVALAASTLGTADPISSKLGTIRPYTGTYYDPQQSGSGLTVDVGPGGMLFLIFETYDEAGHQVNLIAQPLYVPSSESVLQSSSVIGTASGSFYQAANGQCPGCAYRAPTLTPTPLAADFVWSSPRHVTMTFQTYTYHFDAINFESRDDEEFLAGRWALSFVNDNSVYAGQPAEYQTHLPTDLAVMQIEPAPFDASRLLLDPGSSADVRLPPAGAHLYTATCAGNQMGADDTACFSTLMIWNNAMPGVLQGGVPLGTAKALVWYDPHTQSAGFDLYHVDSGGSIVIGPANFHGTLYISPDLLQVHLRAEGPTHATAATDGVVGIALNFARLPATAVRDCYDYPSSSPCH
ncbi:MAG TPA: hypothetical protein VI258_00155 [Rhodanobacteraceae bacterium]